MKVTSFHLVTIFILTVCLSVFSLSAKAEIGFGTNLMATTSGRTVLGLHGVVENDSFSFSVNTTGVQTKLYYHSGYLLSGYYAWHAGDFWWGSVRAGIGASVYYAKRGYRDTTLSSIEESQDFDLGPAAFASWKWLGPLYLRVEAMYGLRPSLAHVLLSSQDLVVLSLGAEF